MKKIYVVALILFCSIQLHAQTAQRLDKEVFRKQIMNQSWMAVSGEQKEDHEDLFFTVGKDSVALAYINWIETMGTMQCTYKLEIVKDNIFELKMGKCDGGGSLKYIYGYLSAPGELSVLLADDRLKISRGLLTDPDWIALQLVKEE